MYEVEEFLDDGEKASQELEINNFEIHTPSLIEGL